jgi:hypothetical protein
VLYQSFVGSYSCGALAPLRANAFVYGITEPHLVLCMMSYMCVFTSWVCLVILLCILLVRAYAHNTKTVGML